MRAAVGPEFSHMESLNVLPFDLLKSAQRLKLRAWLERTSAIALLLLVSASAPADDGQRVDVLVYGGTPAGIAAAMAAAQDGCSVVLVEPTGRIGGLVTNGLSHTDFHTRESLSGAFLDFAKRVEAHYIGTYGADSIQAKQCDGGVFAEPKVNLLVFQQMLSEQAKLRVITEHTLASVQMVGAEGHDDGRQRIGSIGLTGPADAHIELASSFVIDASYEGDLMAMAGVPWRAGREGRNEYGESLAPEQADVNTLKPIQDMRLSSTSLSISRRRGAGKLSACWLD